MMTSPSNLLCLSKSIRMTSRNRSSVLLEGPGFVFLTSVPQRLFNYNLLVVVVVAYLLLELTMWLMMF